jgi:prepilin-type N-terminal cleavage/methylation domain-containing protein/prepilin-type processing-associated H-X9-DG protein
MKKKGFTLVELLVVIAIIALLMGILMPALARVRMIAYRMVCGSNLSGIGKALLLYAGDSQESYPMPGVSGILTAYTQSWGLFKWDGAVSPPAHPYGSSASTSRGSIGSIFYMLVKYEDVSPKQFNCKGDSGAEVFKLSTYASVTTQTDVTKVYDFGPPSGSGKGVGQHVSYSYHNPFTTDSAGTTPGHPISVNSKPGSPLAADRNPGMDKNALAYLKTGAALQGGDKADGTTAEVPYKKWSDGTYNEYKDKDLIYNAYAHQREGQNVLFNDGHVTFASTTNVGIDNDNIYQRWITGAEPATVTKPTSPMLRETGGYFPNYGTYTYTSYIPADVEDALLINEPQK